MRKGLDLVLLSGPGTPPRCHPHAGLQDVAALVAEARPAVIAIDAPPWWGRRGGSRLAERELLGLGIRSFATPSDPVRAAGRFYDWMRVGFEVFATAERLGYPRYRSGKASGTALEVFPHATAVALGGPPPPRGAGRVAWRRDLLAARGFRVTDLGSPDLVDAALAALTGLLALDGRCWAAGDPDEGVIVLPVPSAQAVSNVPQGGYRRDSAAAAARAGRREEATWEPRRTTGHGSRPGPSIPARSRSRATGR